MPIFICNDPIKRQNPWATEKCKSLIEECQKRRIRYDEISSPTELREKLALTDGEFSSIVLFPMNESDRRYLFSRYGDIDIHKIVFAHHNINIFSADFSSVINDFNGDMKLAMSHLLQKGCKRIALLHAHPNSYHDGMRIETYTQFVPHPPLLFNASGDKLYPTMEDLMRCHEKIDAVICINDYIAFCFMLFLDKMVENWQKKLAVLSFSDTILSGLHAPSLTSLSFNYTEAGKEIVSIHRTMEKKDRLAYMHFIMKPSLAARQTTQTENPTGVVFADLPHISREEFQSVIAPQAKCMPLEKMLAGCDRVDFEIIYGLLLAHPLSKIQNDVFLSQSAVKHRIRKYRDVLKFDRVNDLAAWLRLWIDPQKLKEKIR